MNFTEVIKNSLIKKSELDDKALTILQLFCYTEHRSVAEISEQLNLMGVKMAYKNVHKRVQKLESLHLIQKDGSISKHEAIYYRLTPEGIYMLFLERSEGIVINQCRVSTERKSVSNVQNFLKNYGDDLLFKSFVFPFFNKETLNKIGSAFLWDIYDYLHNCCEEIQSMIAREDLAYYEKKIFLERCSW
jgi:DNA-binding Lrp family transcriptional regulator